MSWPKLPRLSPRPEVQVGIAVELDDTAHVDKAVTLGGEQLDGRPIRIDYAGQKKKEGGQKWGGGSW